MNNHVSVICLIEHISIIAFNDFFLNINIFADDINLWRASTLNKILERGELRVGLEPGYLPFEMKDKKGRLIGYDVDIAKAMAKAMGVKLKIEETVFDGIIASLLTNESVLAEFRPVKSGPNRPGRLVTPMRSTSSIDLLVCLKHSSNKSGSF